MEGEADVDDLARGLFLRDPFADAKPLQFLPRCQVGQHVHEVIIDPIGAQPAQLFLKETLDRGRTVDQVLRQLGRDIDLIAQLFALQDRAEGFLAAGIGVGCVEIIDAELEGAFDFPGALVDVDARAAVREPHAAESEEGNVSAVSVLSVLHNPHSCNQ